MYTKANGGDLKGIEKRLRLILENYQRAQVRGDFYEAVLAVHTAVENAIDVHLGGQVIGNNSFNEKFNFLLPEIFDSYNVDELNKKRSFYAHPKQLFKDEEIRGTAVDMVNVALAAWPELFGRSSPVPAVQHPELRRAASDAKTADRLLHQKENEIQDLKKRIKALEESRASAGTGSQGSPWRGRFRLPWRVLIPVLVLPLPFFFLAGFTYALWRQQFVSWYWALVPTLMLGLLLYFLVRNLWKFLRQFGLVRLVTAVSIALVLATLIWMPFTARSQRWNQKVSGALDHVLILSERLTAGAASAIFSGGASLAGSLFPGEASSPLDLLAAPSEPADIVVDDPQTSPTFPGASSGENRVRVQTDGSRLMCRTQPGTGKEILARLENGAELRVVEEPVSLENYTWLRVASEAGDCWCVADFLVPLGSGQ